MAQDQSIANEANGATGRGGKRLHRQTLVDVNVSVYTARRNVAHDRALAVLRNRVSGEDREKRRVLYGFCSSLLEEAIESTRRSLVAADAPALHYLRLLRDTVSAIQSLVKHELTLARESESFTNLFDVHLFEADSIFSTSEMGILGCVEELLKFGESILRQDTEERLARFTDDDRRRYGVAESEFRVYYARREAAALRGCSPAPKPR